MASRLQEQWYLGNPALDALKTNSSVKQSCPADLDDFLATLANHICFPMLIGFLVVFWQLWTMTLNTECYLESFSNGIRIAVCPLLVLRLRRCLGRWTVFLHILCITCCDFVEINQSCISSCHRIV